MRVQSERGHHVISEGPYRIIRHPGYAAAICWGLCGGFALGSWWAFAPLFPVLVLLVRRTVIEDRYLRANLPGYLEYAARIRFRLIPGLW